MFYNRISRVWVIDLIDYALIGVLLGSLAATRLKEYLSEKKAMKRLKNSIIKKSELVSDRPIFNFKETKISNPKKKREIFKALFNKPRGGQFEDFQADPEFSPEMFKLALGIKGLVERLAIFLKERELKGVLRFWFKNGRLILEFILCNCNIDLAYAVVTEGLSIQVIVVTTVAGGAVGFTLAWFSAAAALVLPPAVISTLLTRNVVQQIVNQKDYSKFKKMLKQMLEDNEIKQTIRGFYMEGEVPTTSTLEMKPFDSAKNSVPEFTEFNSDQTLEEFIKARMEEELGLIEEPTQKQLEKIINRKPDGTTVHFKNRKNINRKPKGKTVYFKDFIDEIADSSDSDDIIDAEIVKKLIRVKGRNEEL